MFGSINFYLLSLISEKHRKIVKVLNYLSYISFYLLIFANMFRVFGTNRLAQNIVFCSTFSLMAILFLVAKVAYSVFRKKQNAGDDEILNNYINALDKHMKKSNIFLGCFILCLALAFGLAILGFFAQKYENLVWLSTLCIVIMFLSLMGCMVFFILKMVKDNAFEKSEKNKEILYLRRKQVLADGDDNLKTAASNTINSTRQESYIYPESSFRKKWKKMSNIFAIGLIIIMLAIIAPCVTILVLFDTNDAIFRSLTIAMSSVILFTFAWTLGYAFCCSKLIKQCKEYLETLGERYTANINYINYLNSKENKNVKLGVFVIACMSISTILGYITGALGLHNPLAIWLAGGAIILFLITAFVSIIVSVITSQKNRPLALELQTKIDEQEKRFNLLETENKTIN